MRIPLVRVSLLAVLFPVIATGQVTFTDVSVAAGVSALHWDGVLDPNASGAVVEFNEMTAGAAAGDYDRDGWPDLYVTRINQPNLLYRNLGDGTFAEVAAAAGVADNGQNSGCLWVDLTNDGWLDLVVLDFEPNSPNHVFVNQADGTFVDQAAALGLTGGSPLSTPALYSTAAAGDYDKDGDLDILMAAWNQQTQLFRNEGGVYVSRTTSVLDFWMLFSFGWSASFADIDGDTWPDFVYAADFGTSQVYRNLGDGTFARQTAHPALCTDENGMGSAVGDYDGDGDLDWFVTSIYDPNDTCDTIGCGWGTTGNRLYRNDGDWNFTDATDLAGVRDGQWGWGTSFMDYDNDGDLDLGMTSGVRFSAYSYDVSFNNDPLHLWQNDGSGGMTEVSSGVQFVTNAPGAGKGFLCFDYDRDGDLDVFVANNADYPLLLRNDGGNANHWLQVDLVGHQTNSSGIGARLTLQRDPNGPTQVREITGGANFMTANEYTAHFGLGGAATAVHQLTIYWPVSDRTILYRDLPVDQRLTIHEPCPGDVDGDLSVTLSDLAAVLGNFGASDAARTDGDLTDDRVVNLNDLGEVLGNFGQSCPA